MPWWNAKDKSKRVSPLLGRTRPLKERKAISRSRKKRLQIDPEFRRLLKEQQKKLMVPTAIRKAVATRRRGGWYLELGRRMAKRNKGLRARKVSSKARLEEWADPVLRRKRVLGMRRMWAKASKEKRERYAKMMVARIRSLTIPNASELKLKRILSRHFPGEFKLNVKGEVVIGGRIPDFVNVNGRKVVVELAGEFWHPKEYERKRAEYFKKFGFRTAVVWSKQLKDEKKVVNLVKGAL